VSSFGGEIGIADAIEHEQVVIGGGDSMEGDIWTGPADRLGGEMVHQICGSVKPFYPVVSRNGSLRVQGAQHIINGKKNALGFTVMWRSVWIKHP
jgi:hypothetical protein